jgi:hypothetical protein
MHLLKCNALCKTAITCLFIVLFIFTGCNLKLLDNQFTVDDLEIMETILKDAWSKYESELEKGREPRTARENLARWLRARSGVEDAGVADDESTVWAHFKPGMTACVMTEGRMTGDEIKDVQASLRLSTAVSPPLRTIPPSRARTVSPSGAGMTARLFTPFNHEFKDTDEIMDLKKYYNYPEFSGSEIEDVFTYKDEKAGIDAVKAALVFNAPAMHFIMNTHGGLTKLHTSGEKVNYIYSGDYLEPSTAYALYAEDIEKARIVPVKIGSGVYLAFTPEFVKHYATFSGKIDEDDKDWLSHYVHINACYSYHQSMVDAFVENGGVCYSGFTYKVSCSYGKYVGLTFFGHLTDCLTVKEAYEMTEPKIDPAYSKCKFKAAGNIEERRYFYRSHVSKDGAAYASSSTAEWTSMSDTSEGTHFTQNMYDDNGDCVGILTVMIDSPQKGTQSITSGSATKISYDVLESNVTWEASSDYISDGCSGYVEITKFEDELGGTIEGLFEATAVDTLDTNDPPRTASLEGTFIAVRSKD